MMDFSRKRHSDICQNLETWVKIGSISEKLVLKLIKHSWW